MAQKKHTNDPYDLCACYEPTEEVPEEFIEPWERETKPEDRTYYANDEDGVEYFYCGNSRTRIIEHFAEDGKTLDELMEDMILREAKKSNKD